jgi:hypothetical protein
MDSDDLFSIVNAPSGSLTPASGRGVALASAFLSPGGGVPVEVQSSTISDHPVQWGPSLVWIRDHTRICGGQYGVKKNNCFCCSNTETKKDCPSRHVLLKHALTEEASWVHASRIYYHKGAASRAVYAEPFVDVAEWKEEDIAALLGKQFSSWIDWREEALVLQASGASQKAVTKVRTAVKMSKRLPRLFEDGDDDMGGLALKDDEEEQFRDAAPATASPMWLSSLKKGLACRLMNNSVRLL